ncbi:hypothetical protein CDIK_2714 [Cucumispora dikerogammari]|nr:hypothetical protein CDIK_2714 [Cucumispora dikerogammari]
MSSEENQYNLHDMLFTSENCETENITTSVIHEISSSDRCSNDFNLIEKTVYLDVCKLKVVYPKSAIGYFDLIFTKEFYIYLIKQVNKRILRNNNVSLGKPGSVREIKNFIAINLFMGIVRIYDIKTYWDKNINIYRSVFVQRLMSYVRFTEINPIWFRKDT